jgi:hypothetical protein
LAEAPGFGKTILQYDPASKGAKAYRGLANELLTKAAGDGLADLDLSDMGQGVAVGEPPAAVEHLDDGAPGQGEDLGGVDPRSGEEPAEAGPRYGVEPAEAGARDDGREPDASGQNLAEDEDVPELGDHPMVPDKEAGSFDPPQAGPVEDGTLPAWDAGLVDAEHSGGGGTEEPGTVKAAEQDESYRPAEPASGVEGAPVTEPAQADVEADGPPTPESSPTADVDPAPRTAAERAVPQAFSPSQRLVHIVSDEWEGLGVGPEEDHPRDEVEFERDPGHERADAPAAERDEPPAPSEEPPVGKVRRWLFGKSKGGGA